MAKRLFLLVAGALALTACTNEEVIDDVAASRNVIKFENAVNKLSRAKDLTTVTLKQFNVYGFYTVPGIDSHAHEVFKDEDVKNEGTGWKYTNTRYWIPEATYYFYAYSCGSVSKLNTDYGTFKLDTENKENEKKLAKDRPLKINGYLCDFTHQHDLIFANSKVEATAATNSAVSLEFTHILSKLQAKFTSNFPEEYTVVISNVQVKNIKNQGNYSYAIGGSNNGWAEQKIKEGIPYVYLLNTKGEGLAETETADSEISVTSKDANPAKSNTAYVIPCAYTAETGTVTISFDVKVMLGNDQVFPAPDNKNEGTSKTITLATNEFAPEWKEGFSYIYNIAIGPDDIKLNKISFTVDKIKGWEDGGEKDLDINND